MRRCFSDQFHFSWCKKNLVKIIVYCQDTGRDKSWHKTNVSKTRILIRLKQDTIFAPWFQWFEVVSHGDKSSVCGPMGISYNPSFRCPLLFKIGTRFGDPSENPLTVKESLTRYGLTSLYVQTFLKQDVHQRTYNQNLCRTISP